MSVVLRGVSGNLAEIDGTGALKIQGTFSATDPSVGLIGAAAPTSASQNAGPDGSGNLRSAAVKNTAPTGTEYALLVRTVGSGGGGLTDAELRASPVPVTLASTTITGTVAVTGTFWQATQPVSIAGSVAVTGPLTDTQLRASAVPVTLASTTVTGSVAVTNANLDAALSTLLTTAAFQARQPVLGQGTMAGSMAVVIASNQSAIPVTLTSTTITGNVAVTGTFWQATQPVSIAATVAVSSTQLPAALGAQASASSLSVVPASGSSFAVTGTFWQTTQPVSLTSTTITGSVAVTNANLDVALSTLLTSATFTGRINTQGQKAMAASTPVVLASDQSAIPVTLASTTITGSVAVTGTFWQATQPVSIASTITIQGAKTHNNAAPGATNIGALVAIAAAAAPTYIEGDQVLLSTDLTGALRITGSISATNPSVGTNTAASPTSSTQMGWKDGSGNLQAVSAANPLPISGSISATNPSVSATGAAVPAQATMAGGTDGANLRALKVDATGQLFIANPGGAASVLMADATANPTIPQQASFLMGWNGANWDRVKTANTGRLQVDIVTGGGSNASVSTTGAAVPASATYAGVLSGGNLVGMAQPLTDTQLRASAVPVTLASTTITGSVAVTGTFFQATQPISAVALPLPTGAATEATLANVLTTSAFQARIPVNGQGTMATSVPVVLASNQSSIAVTLASTTITGSIAVTNASLDVATSTRLAEATFTTRVPVNGQALMAASVPVVLASNQSAIPVTLTSTTITGTVAATQSGTWNITNISGTISLPTGASTESTLSTMSGKLPATLGQKAMAAALAVSIASDQSAIPVTGTLTAVTSITNTITAAGNRTNNNAVPGATNLGVLGVLANAAPPTWTEGNLVALSSDLSGGLRVASHAVTLASTTITGSVAVTNANLDVATSTRLAEATFTTRIPVNGQAAMAASVPVVLASNQSAIPVTLPTAPASTVVTQAPSSASNTTLKVSNANRKGLTLYNDSTSAVYVKLGATASSASFTIKMVAAAYYELPFGYTGIIDAIWVSANGNMLVTEIT